MKKLSILLLCCFSFGAIAWASQLEIIGPAVKHADPKSLVTIGFTVVNNSSENQQASFSAELPPFWELLSVPAARNLAPGEEAIIPLTVMVPQAAAAGEHKIVFAAKTDSLEAEALVTVIVSRQTGGRLTFAKSSLEITRASRLFFSLNIENTGNCPSFFALRAYLPRGLAMEELVTPVLSQGEIWHGVAVLEASEDAPLGSTWLIFELREGETGTILARDRLPLTVLSSRGDPLNPELFSRLNLEGIWTENGPFRWHGSLWGDSSWQGGGLHLDLQRYSLDSHGYWRGLVSWQRNPWTVAVGNTDYAANTLQNPVEDVGLLFSLQEEGKLSSLFWRPDLPSYFAYRKSGTAFTFLMEKEQPLWFYGRSEAKGKLGRIWGEVGMPVAWRIPAAKIGFRVGGQNRTPTSSWALDWLQAGTETYGRYQDLWRLSLSGQQNPFLFSLYSKHNDLENSPEIARVQEDYAAVGLSLPLRRGNLIYRYGYGIRQEEEGKTEENGWEFVANKYWGSLHLYLSHNQLPLSLPRDYLRLAYYGKVSLWLAMAKYSDLSELTAGLLYRQKQRDWELEWQGQQNYGTQSVRVKLTQQLNPREKIHLQGKLYILPEAQPSWEVAVGYGLNLKVPLPFLKTKGRLGGRIFVDENGDNLWQEDEPTISGVRVVLAGEVVQSDREGYYEFSPQLPGEYPLFLQADDLPLGLLPKTATSSIVRLEAGEETSFHWPVAAGGRVAGVLTVEGSGAKGVWLALSAGGKVVARTVTDSQGNFQFPYVLPGKYQLELLPGQFSVPYYLSVTEVTLKAREEKMLEVAAEKEEKPIEQLFRTPQWQIFEIE
jgi:hypothetical protein